MTSLGKSFILERNGNSGTDSRLLYELSLSKTGDFCPPSLKESASADKQGIKHMYDTLLPINVYKLSYLFSRPLNVTGCLLKDSNSKIKFYRRSVGK